MPGVFVTGASSGIGAALAHAYARRGATLGLVARGRERLQALAKDLGTPTALYALDVADQKGLREAAADFIGRHGVPDVVIAAAGISVGTEGGIAEDLGVLERILITNVVGLAATLQPFVAPMREARRGKLVGIGSVSGVRGLPGAGAYSASKAAVAAWMESLRVELHGSAVRAITILPGYVDTAMTRGNPYRMPFLLPPEEFARRALRAIDAGKSHQVIPWQMAMVAPLLRMLPNAIYDRLAAKAGRKPRNLPL